MSRSPTPSTDKSQAQFILSVISVVGLGGFVMLGVVLASLFIGLWADRFLGTRPLFTIGLLLLSAPLSIYLMYRIAMQQIARIVPKKARNEHTQQGED